MLALADKEILADRYRARTMELLRTCIIRRDLDQPWLGGRTRYLDDQDRLTVSIDKRIPRYVDGIDTNRSLPIHEISEWLGENDGLVYDVAHKQVATVLEKEEVERQNSNAWMPYTHSMDGYIVEVDDERIKHVLPGMDVRPFADDDRRLLRQIMRLEHEEARDFDPEEPRDEQGRWTAGSGGNDPAHSNAASQGHARGDRGGDFGERFRGAVVKALHEDSAGRTFGEMGAGGGRVFHQAISEAKASHPFSASVALYSPDEYDHMRTFVTADGKAGFALKGDDIVSVFRHADGPKGVGATMLKLATDEGGRRLDAFDTVLPHIYSQSGFKAVARLAFDPQYQPADWNAQRFKAYNNGHPDVVFMVYDPSHAKPYEAGDGARVDSYDAGVAMQERALHPRLHDADPSGTFDLSQALATDLARRWDDVRRVAVDAISKGTFSFSADSFSAGDPVVRFRRLIDGAIDSIVMPVSLNAIGEAHTRSGGAKLSSFSLMEFGRTQLAGIADSVSNAAVRKLEDGLAKRRQAPQIAQDVAGLVRAIGQRHSSAMAAWMTQKAAIKGTLDTLRSRGVTHVGVIPEHLTRDAGKRPKASVQYERFAKDQDKRCELCSHFEAPRRCEEVVGLISPRGWCNLFHRKGSLTDAAMAEIVTAGDDRVCQECQDIADAGPYTLDEAEELLPVHPNCRCDVYPIPTQTRDFNPNHAPSGSPEGGQFTSGPSGGDAGGGGEAKPVENWNDLSGSQQAQIRASAKATSSRRSRGSTDKRWLKRRSLPR